MLLTNKRVLIAGGTGLIGGHLCNFLKKEGCQVELLSRKAGLYNGIQAYQWSVDEMKISHPELDKVDVVINLAGASIADKKWSKERKKVIIESRINAAKTFEKYMLEGILKPKVYLSASAVGYYGDRGGEELTEDSDPGDDFLAQTTIKWEKSADLLKQFARVIKLRIGIVLSARGGALPEMANPQRFGIGALLGGGNQYMPWIHIDDVAGMILFLLTNEKAEGVFNAVSPNPVTQKEMVSAIAKGMGRPAIKLPAPAFALKLAMGEMATLVLNSNKVIPRRILNMGYEFIFTEASTALKDLKERKI
ncbi:MAG: TIGR01777 family protein [Saprospirales bacterium]|nr:MAG: TIGR01777 family protein [Saprospirales bacterium]